MVLIYRGIQKEKYKEIGGKTLLNLPYQDGNPGTALETKFKRADVTRNTRLGGGFLT